MTPAARNLVLLAAQFDPMRLFRAGEAGAEFDDSYTSAIFQDSPGITAAVVGQPVGLMLDKRLGLVPGSDFITNGGFDNGLTGWTVQQPTAGLVSVVGGKCRINSTDGTLAYIAQTPVITGKRLAITFDLAIVSGTLAVADGVGLWTFTTSGTYTFYPAASANLLQFKRNVGVTDLTIDNISVREIPGNHVSQAAAGSRPTLQTVGANQAALFDGIAQNLAATTGGGASTAAFLCVAFRTTVAGQAQTLWSDRTGNTGLKLEITVGNALTLSGGNGASINTVTGDAVSTNTDYVATALYEGGVLSLQLSAAPPVTGACTLSAGTAGFTMGKDNGAASGFFKGYMYGTVYRKDAAVNATDVGRVKKWLGRKAGLSL